MRTNRPVVAVLLAGLLTLTSAGAAGASAPGVTTHTDLSPTMAQPADAAGTLTLITGDRVSVTDNGSVVVHPGVGRDQVTFLTQRAGEHTYVIPSDAVPLLAAGRLDRRLFDVALLRDSGYHQRPDLPLIVTDDGVSARRAVTSSGGRVVRDLPAVDGAAVRVDHADAVEFWDGLTGDPDDGAAHTLAAGVSTVWLDGLRQPLLDQSVPQVGAPAAWEVGLDGTGVRVAVLDTGIDATHPDLADRLVGQENFTDGEEDDRDLVGHGTHVASTVAGNGAGSDGQFRGVAHGAALLDGKVCTEGDCAESWLIAGMQWAAEQGADVVNISLGGQDTPELDPVEQAVETLTAEHGVLFVISAGNDGADATVNSPASTNAALAVGAVDQDDELAEDSSRGPRIDGALKPDLTAPGVDIVAANSKDGFLGEPGQPYTTLSGTSMATPHVAGAAAILTQQHPDWSPALLKAALMGSAAPHPDLGVTAQGAGRLDVARAIAQPVTMAPASVSFDRQPWPHDDDQRLAETVTYHNHSEVEVVMELAVTATGPDGAPAPAGMFTAGATTVTVPAGGNTEVSLAADTTIGEVDGYYGGHLTATAGDLLVRTPFGIDRELETYDVTLSHLDRDGAPTGFYSTALTSHDGTWFVEVSGEPEVTVRVPAGDYFLRSLLDQERGERLELTMLVQPRLEVSEDTTVRLDARAGKPVSLRVPDRRAVPTFHTVDTTLLTDDDVRLGTGLVVTGAGPVYTARVGPAGPVPGLTTAVSGGLAVPTRDGDLAASRSVYNLTWFVEDDFITGFEREAKRRELARVRADHATQVGGSQGSKGALGFRPALGGIAPGRPIDLPHTRTEYYNTGDGLVWRSFFSEFLVTDEAVERIILLEGEEIAYEPGQRYRERWNYGGFGPVASELAGVFRLGDELVIVPVMHGDGAGHLGFAPSTGTVRVSRDGELIAEEPYSEFGSVQVPVPPERADYRVEVEAQRVGSARLSSRTSLAWEFESGHVDDETLVPLPVSAVRFSPNLAPDNTTRAGRPFLVPVTVDPAPGAAAGERADLSVDVSFDDGQTWRGALVLADRFVLVVHPRGHGFVSLRATATDTEGNPVEQTVIRAYEIS